MPGENYTINYYIMISEVVQECVIYYNCFSYFDVHNYQYFLIIIIVKIKYIYFIYFLKLNI